MKKITRYFFPALFSITAITYVSATPTMDVTVSDATGHLTYKGKVDAEGAFTTDAMAPGNYVVQFDGKGVSHGRYALVVSAGRQKVVADEVEGSKFTEGGVAMRLKVAENHKITGRVFSLLTSDGQVRIVKGRRYVWVPAGTGSNLGGSWEEEGITAPARNVINIGVEGLRRFQDRGGHGL
jgi:hypothetical protein